MYKILLAKESEKLMQIQSKTKRLEKHEKVFINKLRDTQQLEDHAYKELHHAILNSIRSQKTRLDMVRDHAHSYLV